MNEEVRLSRLRVSRRRALSLGGGLGLAGVLAACGDDASSTASATGTTATAGTAAASTSALSVSAEDVLALLDKANTCTTAKEETQGPYWFDVDSIRSDVREDRPGTVLALALRVHDVSECSTGGTVKPVANSVVEIWHCDAGGIYSGFESSSAGANGGNGGTPPSGAPGGTPPSGAPGGTPPSGAPPAGAGGGPGASGSGETSDGSYSVGDTEAVTSDDGTYLRGAQVADSSGVVRFTTIYPGWYTGRTVHIHCKVHIDKKTVLTTQIYFDDDLSDELFTASPYDEHTGRDTRNDNDSIYDPTGLVTIEKRDDGYLAVINLGIDV